MTNENDWGQPARELRELVASQPVFREVPMPVPVLTRTGIRVDDEETPLPTWAQINYRAALDHYRDILRTIYAEASSWNAYAKLRHTLDALAAGTMSPEDIPVYSHFEDGWWREDGDVVVGRIATTKLWLQATWCTPQALVWDVELYEAEPEVWLSTSEIVRGVTHDVFDMDDIIRD